MVATAVWTTRTLAQHSYGFALNVGVCGAFDRALHPGTVVHVASDCLAELGAEDDDRFVTIHELQLLGRDEFPFRDGRLHAAPPANAGLARLPAVTGITVNTVHGRETSIAAVQARAAAQVESMEGAAFMYACMVAPVPFAQVRAVSNIVEKRNRAAWKLPEAVRALAAATVDILDHL
jgi:futalosine hydrolase